jgi:hypothetical protein
VGGTADGKYLGKTLQGAKDNGMENVHERAPLRINNNTAITS